MHCAEGTPAEWLQEKDEDGDTPLHFALDKRVPSAAALGLLDACPEAAKIMDEEKNTPLEYAVYFHAAAPVVAALILAWPGAVTAENDGGDTPLHSLAASICNSPADRRHKCTLCYLLIKKGGSLAAINNAGYTPAACAANAIAEEDLAPEDFDHLLATFREIAMLKKHRHLSLMHFRDWTTVSHAWCTPSAKLVAVTVLLVGDTFKRGLLPRLPMDCWYRILNCIPRHELRLGDCGPDAEQAALVQYRAILHDAGASIEATNAAAAAAAAMPAAVRA